MKDVVMETLKEFKVAHRVFGVTTDRASNMIKFFDLLADMETDRRSFSRTAQFSPEDKPHIVNKVAEVAIDKKVDTVSKIRACVVYSRRPTIRENFLASIHPATEDLKLPLDVATRWNSLFHMVESAYARRVESHDHLSTRKGAIKNDVPSAGEWIEVEDLIELLKPLEAVSVDCSAFKSSTFHLALAELEFLRSHLKAFNEDYAKAHWICELTKDTLAKLEDWLKLSWKKPGIRIQVPMIARLLDPSIKDAYLPTVESRTAASTTLKHIVQLYKTAPSERRGSESTSQSAVSAPKEPLSIRERLIAQATSGADTQLNEEDQYFLDPKESAKRDVLDFWSMSELRYPTLHRIVKDVLAAQASSVLSESAFSGSGRYITVLRNRLEPEAIQAMLCLNSLTNVFEAMVATMIDDE
ncbi:hypothetical protein RvY_10905 [Ramazzottius varieornatus]|uniref:HAT C-terminal dimerisation domain-containing protein n=1 Tax=Ramazzottius varieornatus TaxID=947166 RepID=A0A1D1VEA9_RAMVA|nr:hypothetical protein RvY_10905 [Ramazzottius varieornatus]